ncbi:PilZ domain-containing protein [Marivivens sp. JLT3646]|uniref:PilZ domain-containing protein n=1 Tax=Marivivens sp. JLT3646 TaxID=1920883 RepID=UPI0007FFE234|nr:PilZ domain-containing protein [Marivivens sp. JLT3646]APO86937.1 hypothetical protein BSK21_07770 [Marivivens sp. JLT3646]OBR39665.1 hypothetical protein A9199_01450 [Donghicola sp. JL3646]
MMFVFRLFYVVFITLAPLRSADAAEDGVDCRAVHDLATIIVAQQIALTDPTRLRAALDHLARNGGRFDAASARWMIGDRVNSDAQVALVNAAQLGAVIAGRLQTQTEAQRARIGSALLSQNRVVVEAAIATLPRLTDLCDSQARAQSFSTMEEPLITPRTAAVNGGLGFLALITVGVFFGRIIALRHAKARRFTCSIETTIPHQGKVIPARIIDISRLGAKITLTDSLPFERRQRITVMVNGQPIPCRVAWSNTHVSGIKFRRALTAADLATALGHGPKVEQTRKRSQRGKPVRQNENGTPRGAAINTLKSS